MKRKLSQFILLFTALVISLSIIGCKDDGGGGGGGSAPTVTGVTVTPVSGILAFDETEQLTATATLSDSSTLDVSASATWGSDDPSVIVSASGLVTAGVAEGTATISAQYEGFTGTASIEVRDPSTIVTAIAIAPDFVTIDADATQQYAAVATYQDTSTGDVTSQVTWTSSDLGIAAINATGEASGVNDGATNIIAELDGVTSNTATLSVDDPVRAIDIAPNNASIQLDGTQQYTATATLASGDTIDVAAVATWSSTDTAIAVIAAGGLATADSANIGSTSISAEYDSVTSDTATLTVTDKVIDSIAISAATTIDADDATQFTAIVTYTDTTSADMTGSVNWDSSNTGAATINASGLASGVNDGSTDITASLSGVTSNTVTIIVDDPLRSIDISPDSATLDLLGGPYTQQYTAEGTYASGDAADVRSLATWTSSSAGIATINGDGLATAVAVGSTDITAVLDGVTSDTAALTVGSVPDPTGVSITPIGGTAIDADADQQYTAIVSYNDSSSADMTGSVTWNSSNAGAATINASGLAIGVNNGVTTITATYGGFTSNAASLTVDDPLRSIDISPDSATIDADITQQYTAQGTYASGDNVDITGSVTWISSNTSAATINSSGLAFGVNNGSSNISAVYDVITSDTAVLTVDDPLRSIDISPDTVTLNFSETQQYAATGVYASGDTADLTSLASWTSSDTGIAIIDATGLATSDSTDGSTNIQASYDSIDSDIAALNVAFDAPDLVSIDISPDSATIDADGTQQYAAIGTYDDASISDISGSVNWDSSNTGAATINASGLASGVNNGSTNITAELDGITSDTAVLTVDDPLRSIDISPNSATIDADDDQQYSAIGTYASGNTADLTSSATWDSSNTGIATINASGLSLGVNNGVTTITAVEDGVTSDSSTLTVNDPLRSINISPDSGSIDLSVSPITEQFSAVGTYASGDTATITTNVIWNSSSTGVATIDTNGLATGVNDGSTNITASLDGVASDTGVLTVTDPPVSLDISPDAISIVRGATQQYAATVTYASADTADVTASATWNSSATAAATINGSGLATGVDVGSSNITASYIESLVTVNSDTAVLTVTNEIVSIDISPDTATIDGGATQQYSATATYEDSTTGDVTGSATWDSSDTGVATIDASGLATGVAGSGGTSNITATISAVTSDTAVLTVNASISPPTIDNIDMHRGNTSTNTEMELWGDWLSNSGAPVSFSQATTSYYAYIGGFDQVTLVVSATDADTLTVNGTSITSDADHTVTFAAQGENTITVYAANGAGNVTYTVTVNFLIHYNMVYGLYAPYMLHTKTDKWFTINDSRDTGDELTIDGNVSGQMYWRISNSYTINCDDVVADEAAEYFGDDASDYCGASGLFGAFNRTSILTAYNDGNQFYSGTQDGNAWSADWHTPGNEGGLTFVGDSVGDITNVFNKDGNLRGNYDYYLDGVLVLQVYQHYVINGGDLDADDPDSYADYIYMPGTAWEENVRIDYAPSTPSPLE